MATVRVFLFQPTPGAEAIVATLRFGWLEAADEERPSEREVILRYSLADARWTFERLVALLERYHPCWRRLVAVSLVGR